MNTPRIKQSVVWWCYVPERLSPEQFVRAVAEAGYAAVEQVPRAYLPLAADHGLAVSALKGHESETVGMNRRDQHARIEDELGASIALAEKWKVPNLICFSGNRGELGDARGAESTAECLARVAPVAHAAGCTLVLELLNSKVDHPDYQADHTAWGLQVVEMVSSPAVKLLYDIYHMQVMEGDLIRTLRAAAPRIGHYHTAGNPGRADLDDTQEIYYPAVLRAIAGTGYNGYLAHEFVPKGDPVTALRATFAQCAPLLASPPVAG